MVNPVPEAKEPKQISDELAFIYLTAVDGAKYAQGFLVHRHGNPNEVYETLYDGFVGLYFHTRADRQMIKDDRYKRLMESIDAWTEKGPRTHNVRALIREGLVLFKKYQFAVIQTGAVIIKRE